MARPIKYTSVAAQLRDRIAAGTGVFAAGNLLPAEEALAAQFGVTRQTLRKAVSVLVDEGIVIRRPGSGTFVPQPAARGAQRDSLLYVGKTAEHYYQAFYEALCAEADQRGKAVTAFTPSNTPDSLRRLRQLADSHQRLICVSEAWEQVREVLPPGMHVTLVSGSTSVDHFERDHLPTYLVCTDTYRATKLAVEYLADLGHRRIGFVSAGRSVVDNPMLGKVWQGYVPYLGYRSGLLERGLTETGILAVPDELLVDGDFVEAHYQYFVRHLDDFDPLPTAFIVANDFRTAPLYRALRERGLRVPEDISVVGVGNTPWAQAVDPPLTSVCLGEAELAHLAVMLNAEPQPKVTRIVRVDPEVVERRSTAPAGRSEAQQVSKAAPKQKEMRMQAKRSKGSPNPNQRRAVMQKTAGKIVMILVGAIAAFATGVRAATWDTDADGNWSDGAKWDGGVPNAIGATAALDVSGGISADRTITLDQNATISENSLLTIRGDVTELGSYVLAEGTSIDGTFAPENIDVSGLAGREGRIAYTATQVLYNVEPAGTLISIQ